MNMPDATTCLLMSSERSGSNLLRTVLGRHSEVSAPSPVHLLNIFVPLLVNYGRLEDDGNFYRLIDDVCALIDAQLGRWSVELSRERVAAKVEARTFSEILRVVYQEEAASQGKRVSLLKDNGFINYPLHTCKLFPSSRIVYLVRDPRDTALSWLNSVTHVGGVSEAARVWRREQHLALEALSLFADEERIRLVKYEQLIADPEGTVGTICEFLGLTYEPGLMSAAGGGVESRESARIKDWQNISSDVLVDNSRKYLAGLSKRKNMRIERIVWQEMKMLGYEPDFVSKIKIGGSGAFGKLYRALMGSVPLLFGGKNRRQELRIRLNRLRAIKGVQKKMRSRAPEWIK